MKNVVKFIILPFLGILLLILISCSNDDGITTVDNNDFWAEASFSFEQAVGDLTKLKLIGINGEAIITGVADLTEITVTGTRKVESDSQEDADDHLNDLSVELSLQGNVLRVETDQPNETQGRIYTVDYSIEVPDDFELDINNVNGVIEISNIMNLVDVDNTNGNVILNNVEGSVLIDLINGIVDGEITLPLNGLIDIYCVNGIINLDIPEDTSADFSASVTNGIIDIDDLELQDIETGSTFVNGTLGAGEGNIVLFLVNGNINVNGY
jgi:DUF4097 and DUF4098 domain-containing protein YvlB